MTSPPQSPANDPGPTHRRVSWTSPEIMGELILLGLIAVLVIVFLFQVVALPVGQDCADERSTPAAPISCFLFQSAPDLAERFSIPNLRLPGRWLPLIAIGIGTPLWFIRLYTVLRRRKAIEEGMIMDLGFRLGEDPEGERRRAFLYFGTLILLVIAVWMSRFPRGSASLGHGVLGLLDAHEMVFRSPHRHRVRGVHRRRPRPHPRYLLVRALVLPLDWRRIPRKRVVHPGLLEGRPYARRLARSRAQC